MKGLTHFSLCSGIGGLDLAAEWAGFETIGQCEIDDYASKVLAKNFKGVKNYGDIRTINARLLAGDGIGKGEITVLSAGIPCQPYSLAGKGLGDCDERDLEQELIRVIGELRPRWVVVENTPGLFARKNQQYFDRILNDISEMGYRVGWGMWRACDVRAPHRRERVFIICRHANVQGYETKPKISKENAESARIHRDVFNSSVERRYTDEIQRGEFEESGRAENERGIQESRVQSERICSGFPHTDGVGLGERGVKKTVGETEKCRGNYGKRKKANATREWWKAEPDVGRVADGVSEKLDGGGITARKSVQREAGDAALAWWEIEPNIPRVTEKIKSRVDRLRCLGNAVVPQQAYPIFKAIADYEKHFGEE